MCGQATLIIPYLWLGDLSNAGNNNFIKQEEINLVINCTDEYPNYFPEDTIYQRIPLENGYVCKSSTDSLLSSINYTINEINSALNQKKSVLVYCRQGHNRSAIIIAAFLIKFYRIWFPFFNMN